MREREGPRSGVLDGGVLYAPTGAEREKTSCLQAEEQLDVEAIPHAQQHPDFRSPGIELYRVTQLLPAEALPPL